MTVVNMVEADNGTRGYRSELRQRQAADTRQRVIEAAAEVFGANGYHGATFAQIAKRAGVSIETVQKHGPKAALLWAAVEVRSFGVEGRLDIRDTEPGRAMLAAGDPAGFAAVVGETILAINEPVAGVWTAALGAAQGDRDATDLLGEQIATIRTQVERLLRIIGDRGWLRTDVPFDDLVEAACVITSAEAYVRFVLIDGRSRDAYREFVARTIRDTILVR